MSKLPGRKAVLVGDTRLAEQETNFPLIFIVDGRALWNTKDGKKHISYVEDIEDIIGEWTEPKPKVKIARAIVRRTPDSLPFVTTYFYTTKEEIEYDFCGNVQILEFPYNGEWKEFDT